MPNEETAKFAVGDRIAESSFEFNPQSANDRDEALVNQKISMDSANGCAQKVEPMPGESHRN
jgi:hypothetical protein